MLRIKFWILILIFCVLIINIKCPLFAGDATSHYQPLILIDYKPVEVPKAEEINLVTEEPNYIISVSDDEIDLMARVVMSESSVLCFDAKQAIAQTIVNRVRDGKWGSTITEVVSYPNSYSTYNNGYPNADCYEAVRYALMYEAFPTDMFYFRTDYYHNFGYPYCHIENTYFSTEYKDYGGHE